MHKDYTLLQFDDICAVKLYLHKIQMINSIRRGWHFILTVLLLMSTTAPAAGQSPAVTKFKTDWEKAPDPIAFLKSKKKKYRIDTVTVTSNRQFLMRADSLAYFGKLKKVYGPYADDSSMIQVIGKAPNIFYRVRHVLLDTPKLNKTVAKKLADSIVARIKRKETTIEDMARIYNTDGSGPIGGDLGWRARGTLIPVMENAILKKKKGDILRVWSPYGLHIIQLTETPVQDVGFALLLRVKP
jgi:hypothetical protein